MIAALTRFMIMLQAFTLAALTLLVAHLAGFSWLLSLLIAAGLLLMMRAGLIFNNYLLSGALWLPMSDGRRRWLPLAARIVQEFACSMRCWFALFPLGRPFLVPANDRGLPPVLLLHGYGANSGFWQPFSRRLRQAGISHSAIDLEPVLADIDDYALPIEQAVSALCAVTGAAQVIVVCHSMGGLAARAWLRAFGRIRAARVITLGTPHAGSRLAGYGIGINARQMLPPEENAESWLAQLAASEDAAIRALFVSIYTRHDNIVAPQASAILPGATNVGLDLVGHVALGFDTEIGERVLAEISSVRRSRSTAGSQ